jgi:3'-5' exoribonuclease
MAGTDTAVIRLSDLSHGQEAVCFAALIKKEKGTDKHGNPFVKCHFRDKRVIVVTPIWSSNALLADAETWPDGVAYRLRVKGNWNVRYGMQLDILECRQAIEEDADDGYDFFDLVESSDQDPEDLFRKLHETIDRCIDEPCLKQLVKSILHDHGDLFKKMPAAQNFHHSYTAGLLEHVWSMARIAGFLADHYARYYHQLNPPLNKGVVVAGAILHDIGKLRELDYHPVEAKYTKHGKLIGHIVMGRDLVRETARTIDGFPEETLLLLEHAILSHHGKREFGSPIAPLTIESLLLSFVDDIDAKMNIVARERLKAGLDDDFTNKLFALDNRQFYRGIPEENQGDDPMSTTP